MNSPANSGVRPAPQAQVKVHPLTISAVVRDDTSELAKGNLHLSIEGRRVSECAYGGVTDCMSFTLTSYLLREAHGRGKGR